MSIEVFEESCRAVADCIRDGKVLGRDPMFELFSRNLIAWHEYKGTESNQLHMEPIKEADMEQFGKWCEGLAFDVGMLSLLVAGKAKIAGWEDGEPQWQLTSST